MANCHQCHPGGEAGLGPAMNDKPFLEFVKKFQVRHGLGAMPSFPGASMSAQGKVSVVQGNSVKDIVTDLPFLGDRAGCGGLVEQQQPMVPNVPETYRMAASTLALLIGAVVVLIAIVIWGWRRLRRA